MNGENVFNAEITVRFLKDKENRQAQENLSLDLASESETAAASPVQMYNINSSSGGGGGSRSLPSTPYCHSSSPVVGGLPRHWNAVPPPAEMMPPVPMFGDRNRHSNNGDNNYNRQYSNTSRGHSPNYWHNCGGTTCGPSHHWEDSQRIDRTHQANTKCFKVPQNRDNSLISGQTPEGIKRICGGSGFNNYSRDINTSRLSYYGMPPSGNHSYNGINNSQHSFPQRKSPSTFYGGNNHNCDNNRWNGQNHSYNQTSQPSRNQRTPSPYFDTKKQQQQRGISPYQQSGSESDEIEHFFNPIQNNSTHIGLHGANGPSLPTELLVTSLDQSIDPKKMKMILGTIFSEHVKVLNISTFVQSDGNYAASVKVPSLQDAQYAISQLHRRRIGYKRILIAYAHSGGPNHQQIRSQIVLLLQEVPGHKLPLFKFREMFESRFLTTVSISDLYKMKDVCIISEDPTGRIISLNPDHRNTPSPYLADISENEQQVELPYCTIHNKKPWIDKGWAEQEMISLPNVTMSLQVLEIRIHQLLKSHNGSLPLPSITNCYEEIFQQPINIDENGVPLEHLISCLSSVELRQGTSSVKFIVWANSQLMNDINNEPVMSPQLITQLSFFSRELVDLLKTAPHCQLLFNRLIPAYHHHFGRQCRVADYGFTKLIDLLDTLKQTVQVMGDGNKRTVTLTHRAQARRFTSDLLRILKSQVSKQITLSEFPNAYEKVIGKPFNIVDYGVCQMHDILIEVSETTVIITNINDNDKLLSIPMREQTPEEIEKTKQFSIQVIELLRHAPQYSMLFNKFVPSYHHHFGHQCRVSDYGFSKLIELFEAIPDIVNIEDTNCGEKRISLTEKESWNVLKDQIIKLISKTNSKSIYVSKIPQMFLYDYGYMLRPEQFNCKSILDLLKKLNDTVNLIDTQDGIKVELCDISHLDKIRLQCRRILMEQREHRLPINVFQHLYKQYYGYNCNFDEFKINLIDTVEFFNDKNNDEFIKLTLIQQFAYNIQQVIIKNNGKIHLDMLENTYKKIIGEECNYKKFGYSSLLLLLQKMSYIFVISYTRNKKQMVFLNRKMIDVGIELPSSVLSPNYYNNSPDNLKNNCNNSMWIKNQNYWDVIKLAGQVGQQLQLSPSQLPAPLPSTSTSISTSTSTSSITTKQSDINYYDNDYYSSIYQNSISPKIDSSPDSDELTKIKNKKSVWNTPPQRPYDEYDTCIDIPSFTVPQWDDFNNQTNLLSPTKNLLPAVANPLNPPNSPFYNDKLQHVIAPHPSELPLPSLLALSSKRDTQLNNESNTDSRLLGNSLEINSPNNSGYYSLSESDSSALLNVTPSKRQLMGKRRLAAQFSSPIDE